MMTIPTIGNQWEIRHEVYDAFLKQPAWMQRLSFSRCRAPTAGKKQVIQTNDLGKKVLHAPVQLQLELSFVIGLHPHALKKSESKLVCLKSQRLPQWTLAETMFYIAEHPTAYVSWISRRWWSSESNGLFRSQHASTVDTLPKFYI